MVAAAAYLRVSTEKQDVKTQRHAITRAATARGDRIRKAFWFEEKKSGGTIDRAALQKLRAAVRAGVVGRVYVFAIDRLGRSGIADVLRVVEEFRRHGAELVSISDPFDVSGPAADVVLAVLAWAAQMQRRKMLDLMRAARVRVEASGGRWGRPRRIDPTTLERARALQKKKKTLRQIAQSLKVPRSTLSDALSGRGHYAAAAASVAQSPKKSAARAGTKRRARAA
jgi:DNA invertase Pin-like site-specific DNA recombinase